MLVSSNPVCKQGTIIALPLFEARPGSRRREHRYWVKIFTPMAVRAMFVVACLACFTFAAAELAIRLPVDVPVIDGVPVNVLCGSCCVDGAYCGTVSEDIVIVDPSGQSANLHVTRGSSMTCMLRDRNVFGAVDGGLCVPSSLSTSYPLANLCRAFDKRLSPSHTLSGVIYQSSLAEQDTCGPCCDGHNVCDASSVCRPTTGRDQAFCVPANVTKADHCGKPLLMDQAALCESCDEPSPSAELYQAQFKFSRRHLSWLHEAQTPSHSGYCGGPEDHHSCHWYQHCVSGICKRRKNACNHEHHCEAHKKCVGGTCIAVPHGKGKQHFG